MRIPYGMLTCRTWILVGLALPGSAWGNGAVYAMTNALGTNQIVVWARAANGTLTPLQTINTGGGGSGTQLDPTDSLGSQGSIVLDRSHRHLFAVNTETFHVDPVGGAGVHDCQVGSISSFLVAQDGRLTFAEKVSSGGLFPDSLTVRGSQLYVLNSGGPGLTPFCGKSPNITGFRVSKNGNLTPIAGSTRVIDPGPTAGTGSFLNCDPGGFPTTQFECGHNPPAFPRSPGQIGFTPEGDALVVTVKSTNSIYVFPFDDDDGLPGKPAIWKAKGPNQPTYFGFSFDSEGNLIVSEPFGATPTIPAAPKSAVSSFAIGESGALKAISSSVPNGQGTSCWVVVDPLTKRYAYIGNNATSDISSYVIGDDGRLKLLAAVAASAHLPNDLAVAKERGQDQDGAGASAFLYVLNAGNGTVGAWKINHDGSLTSLGTLGGLPALAGAQGLVAY